MGKLSEKCDRGHRVIRSKRFRPWPAGALAHCDYYNPCCTLVEAVSQMEAGCRCSSPTFRALLGLMLLAACAAQQGRIAHRHWGMMTKRPSPFPTLNSQHFASHDRSQNISPLAS